MNKIEKIKKILTDDIYAHCGNCKHVEEDMVHSPCDYCHKKVEGWELSEDAAEELAYKILDIVVKKNE